MTFQLYFILSLLLPGYVQASLICESFISRSLKPEYKAYEMKPMNGVLIELSDGESIFALGPYFGGSHQSLLFNLKSKYKFDKATVRWAGEVLISMEDQKPKVHLTTERAVSLNKNGFNSKDYKFSVELFNTLDGFTFPENDYKLLHRFLKSGAIAVARDYQYLNRTLNEQAIVPLSEYMQRVSMLEFREEITRSIMVLNNLLNQGPLVGTEARLVSALKLLEGYLQDYILYSSNADILALEKVKAALGVITEVLNSNTGDDIAATNIEGSVVISALNKRSMRELYESVLIATNITLQNTNPGVTFDYKVRSQL